MDQLAAIAAAVLLGGLVSFQLVLAAGAPLGEYAWGGAHRILPRGLRIGSVVATFIYVLAALIILEAVRLVDFVASVDLPRNAVWLLAGLFGVGTIMNAISRSRKERRMALVALALCGLCVVVAVAGTEAVAGTS
jgi:uncharacterized protein with ACT and thioredoxin-like domain